MYNDAIKSKLSGFRSKLAIKPVYLIVAFINGAVILMLEIIDARIMAPYFGTSIYVWTAIIGVILTALSLGYWYGGVLADKTAKKLLIADIFLLASTTLLLSRLVQDSVLSFVIDNVEGLRLQAFVAAMIIFFPLNALLGMVSPYIAEISLKDTSKSGRTVGSLSAAGTLGSIFGVFITGYFLLGVFGNSSILIFLVMVLACCALILRQKTRHLVAAIAIISVAGLIIVLGASKNSYKSSHGFVVYDGDSAYSRVIVEDTHYGKIGLRGLITNEPNVYQSYTYIDSPTPVFAYARKFQSISRNLKDTEKSLLIGGGAYTVARDFVSDHPDSKLDVVELDPKLIEIARKYFSLNDTSNLRNITQDGRTFLNANDQKYNLIMMDAYSGSVPPFQLSSVEAVTKMRDSLDSNGLLIANIFSYAKGDDSAYFWSQYKTYSSVFEHVALIRADTTGEESAKQNYVLIASNNQQVFDAAIASTGGEPISIPDLNKYMIFTDNFAPVEQLTATNK